MGMKRKDVQKCILCNKGMLHSSMPMFYTIKINRMVLDLGAIEQTAGLEQYLGSTKLAEVMGPNLDIAECLSEGREVWVCANCAIQSGITIAELTEKSENK